MSRILVVNTIPFEIPEQGEQAPWGENLTEFFTEVAKVLNSVNGPADILESSATINNNVTSPSDIPGFVFNPSIVRSFAVRGNVYRNVSGVEYSEEFLLTGLYQGTSGWVLAQQGMGDAGIEFSITSLGQVQYISTNLVGTHSGLIKYRGVGILAV
jgi:hypothetical protein